MTCNAILYSLSTLPLLLSCISEIYIMSYILLIVFVILFMHNSNGLQCVDDKNGVCETNALFGWCYHNKLSGEFNCDANYFCKNRQSIRGLRTSGCFSGQHCCCNQGNMCNYGHIDNVTKIGGYAQTCQHVTEITRENILTYAPCIDPWCFSFIFKTVHNSSQRSMILGCQSRMHYRYTKSKNYWHLFKNDTWWENYDILMDYNRCKEIGEQAENMTIRGCIDIEYKRDMQDFQGKFCCCKGSNDCNAKASWDEKAKKGRKIAKFLIGKGEKLNLELIIIFSTIFLLMVLS